MKTELRKFSCLRKSFLHERFFLQTRGFNKLWGFVFPCPVFSQLTGLRRAEWAKRGDMTCVWEQGEGGLREDKVCLPASCLLAFWEHSAGHQITRLSFFTLWSCNPLQGLRWVTNESQQIRGDSYSNPRGQLTTLDALLIQQSSSPNGGCLTKECTNNFIQLQFPGYVFELWHCFENAMSRVWASACFLLNALFPVH